MTIYAETLESPVGLVEVTASDAGVTSVQFVEQPQQQPSSNQHTQQCVSQLRDYFDGSSKPFDVPLDP